METETLSKIESKPKLPLYEWIAILAILCLILALTMISLISRDNQLTSSVGNPHFIVAQELAVYVEGAVQNPGRHIVKRGTLVKEVLALAEPLPDADLRRINMDSKLRNGRIIKVPHQSKRFKKSLEKSR